MNPQDKHGDPEGIVTHPDQLIGIDASLVVLVKDIANLLERHYPGWLWAVQPDKRGGVITLRSLRCSGKYGYVIHTRNVQNDPSRRVALRAAGEILDRYGFKRGAFSYTQWAAAERYMGGVSMDISDKSAKERRRYRDDAFSEAVRTGRIELRVKDNHTSTGVQRQIYLRPTALWDREARK